MPFSPLVARARLPLIACIVTALAVFACTRWTPRDLEPIESRGATDTSPPAPHEPPPAPAPRVVEGTLAIANVTVIDVAAGITRPNMTVVVRGEKIVAVEPADAIRVADEKVVVDGRGKFLIPGLWDMHVHLIHESLPAIFAQCGVTGVRHMFAVNPFFRYQRPADAATGPVHPQVVIANQILDGDPPAFTGFVGRNVVVAKDPDSARAAVRELKKRGNDFVKVYSNLPKEAYLAALEEAKLLGMDVAGHVPHSVTVGEASDAGQRSIEHLDGVGVACSSMEPRLRAELTLKPGPGEKPDSATGWRVQVKAIDSRDPKKLDALAQTFKKNGTWQVPTLVQTRAMARLGDKEALDPKVWEELPQIMKEFWKREFLPDGGVKLLRLGLELTRADLAGRARLFEGDRELVKALHKAGVPILAGTDASTPLVVPGLALHEELELLVGAGLTPAESLRAATLNPAVFMRRDKELGTVEACKLADLVLLSANPLEDIKNTRKIEAVWIGGRKVHP